MEIKPIETHYNGYRFRSRLEARWAVFFDALGIKYEYEKEGFDLGDAGWYLPDFWLPEHDLFFEVKGEYPSESDRKKMAVLAILSKKNVVLATGNDFQPPWFDDNATGIKAFVGMWLRYFDCKYSDRDEYTDDGFFPNIVSCPICGNVFFEFYPTCDSIYCWECDQSKPSDRGAYEDGGYFHKGNVYFAPGIKPYATTKLKKAYNAARCARFEHGCSGGV